MVLNLSKMTVLDKKIKKKIFLTPANGKNQDGARFRTIILFFGSSSVIIYFSHILPSNFLKELVLGTIVVKFDGGRSNSLVVMAILRSREGARMPKFGPKN